MPCRTSSECSISGHRTWGLARLGARVSRLLQLVLADHQGVTLSDRELRHVAARIAMNAIFCGVYDAESRPTTRGRKSCHARVIIDVLAWHVLTGRASAVAARSSPCT